jgi:chemotaxis response regulator CheB
MGEDGAQGLFTLRSCGATTVVQDAGSSVVFGMPAAAIKLDTSHLVLPLGEIGGYVLRRAKAVGQPA